MQESAVAVFEKSIGSVGMVLFYDIKLHFLFYSNNELSTRYLIININLNKIIYINLNIL